MKNIFLVAFLSGLFSLSAAPLNFNVIVDTSAFQLQNGTISFQFNSGGVDAGTATISGFAGAALGAANVTGGVSGSLPGVVTITFAEAVNELLQDVTFGSSFQFALEISGDLIENPLDLFGSGATFGLVVTQGDTTTFSSIDVLPGGESFVVADPSATIEVAGPVTAVPEPSSAVLFLAAIPAFWAMKLRRS